MTILIGKYEFEGPFNSITYLQEKAGLYAVLTLDGPEYELIHVAQAENIKEHIELSDTAQGPVTGKVMLAACYTPRSGIRERGKMIDDINSEFDYLDKPDCKKKLLAKTAS